MVKRTIAEKVMEKPEHDTLDPEVLQAYISELTDIHKKRHEDHNLID